MMRANSFNTGIASEYLILSKLYRLELEAYMSQGNKKSVDLRVILNDGTAISIDVKSVRGYSSLVVNNVTIEPSHFIVFVIYNNKFEDLNVEPGIYIVPSTKIPDIISNFGEEKRIMKGKLESYKNRWSYITDGGEVEKLDPGAMEEMKNELTIQRWNKVLKMKKEGLNELQIRSELEITKEEYENLPVDYYELTGN